MQIEFAVQMKCQSCADKIKSNLQDSEGIDSVKVSFDKGIVLVKTSLPSSVIKEKLEAEGNIAVLNGYGNEVGEKNSLCKKHSYFPILHCHTFF